MCLNVGSSDDQTKVWSSIYGAPIADRLNIQAAGANLTGEDVTNLIQLCAFGNSCSGHFLHFIHTCGIYAIYYGTGYVFRPIEIYPEVQTSSSGLRKQIRAGSRSSAGYINELLARVAGLPVKDNMQTNRTLDSSPATFPLNHTLYADLSHHNEIEYEL